MDQPRVANVTNAANKQGTAVSDQARTAEDYQPPVRENKPTPDPEAAPGNPHHARGWGAQGTTDRPPRSAITQPPQAGQVHDLTPAPQQAVPPVPPVPVPPLNRTTQRATPPVQPAAPVVPPQQSPAPQFQIQQPDNSGEIEALKQQVSNLGTLLSTALAQLNTINPTKPLQPGTAMPQAPTPHGGSDIPIHGRVPRVEGPVIPKPIPGGVDRISDPTIPRLPNQSKIPELTPEEENWTKTEYIEHHFRYRDLSIAQIAYMVQWDERDVIDALKEMGYQFVDGV
jgi:hypothetical protein